MELNNIPYKIAYKNIRNPRLEFKTGNLTLHLPYGYKDEQKLLEKYKNWISKKYRFIKECREIADRKVLNSLSDNEFKKIALFMIEKHDINNKIRGVSFRNFKNKWASIDSKNQITLNKKMAFLPDHLIEYIIFHEIMHTIERRHGIRFKELMSRRYENHKKYEKELFAYWLLISDSLQ